MKKQSLLLVAGLTLAFASCQNEGTTAGGFTEAQVDSIVNVKVSEQMMQMQAQNDSIINAMATMKADSIVAAMKGQATPAPATKPAPTVKKNTPPTKKVEPVEPPKTEKSRNNDSKVVDQKSRNNDAPKSVEDQKRRNNQ